MEEYILKPEDFKQIEDLIKLTSSIEEIYTKLYNLEISGKKDTNEYKKLLEDLKIVIQIEENQYISYNLNYYKCIAWINFLLAKKVPEGFVSNIHSVMMQDYDKRVIRRILRVLTIKMEEDKKSLKEIIPNRVLKLVEEFDDEEADQILSIALNSSIELENAFENDVLNSYLVILQDVINSKVYKIFNDRLINSKYNLVFINPNIEKNILSNNFEVPEKIFINSRFIADLVQLDLNSYNMLKNSYGSKISSDQIIELLNVRDIDYNDRLKASSSVLRNCLIRAALLLMTDETIKDMRESLDEYMESEEYREKYSNNKISEQIVFDSMKHLNRDKTKVNVISFGNRKY